SSSWGDGNQGRSITRLETKLAAIHHTHLKLSLVMPAMVKAAQRDEVVEVCAAAVYPVPDVVTLGARRGHRASRKLATLIARLECKPETRWDHASYATDIDRQAVALDDRH